MNKRIQQIHFVVSVCLLVLVGFLVFKGGGNSKIAFVRSPELIYGYAGMKEMQTRFQMEDGGRRARLDTLSQAYESAHQAYLADLPSLTGAEKQAREKVLVEMRNGVVQYSANVEQVSKTNEAEMLEGVLTQINSFVEGYASEHGYAMVFGTTAEGNVLYGQPAIDITDDLLKALNEGYSGGHVQ